MGDAELRDEGVHRAELNTGLATGVPQPRCGNVVFASGLDEPDCGEPFGNLGLNSFGHEPLQKFLKDQPSRHDEVVAAQRTMERLDLRDVGWRITPKSQRPHAGVDQQSHARERSAL